MGLGTANPFPPPVQWPGWVCLALLLLLGLPTSPGRGPEASAYGTWTWGLRCLRVTGTASVHPEPHTKSRREAESAKWPPQGAAQTR